MSTSTEVGAAEFSWRPWLRDDQGMPASSGSVPSWDELTDEQRCILFEGVTGATLVDVLNAWVCRVRNEDAAYWNRKGAFVAPLAHAARSLVEMGLIEVWQEPVGIGEGGLMLRDFAAKALARPENWWRYDPDENWDPDEDLTRYAEHANASTEPRTTMHTLITVKAAFDLVLVKIPW